MCLHSGRCHSLGLTLWFLFACGNPILNCCLPLPADIDTDTSVVLSRLDFLRRLYRLNYVRLWACRFSKFGPGRVSGLLRTQLLGSRLQKRNCIVLDSQWYPDRTHAVHDEPAEYSGDGDDQPTAAAVNDSST